MVYDPNKFKQASQAIISFDSVDFADGTGVVTLYGMIQAISGTESYTLTRSIQPSRGTAAVRKLNPSTSYTFNFGAFNSPRTIRGTAILIAELENPTTMAFTVTIKHVDGGTGGVTNISSTITSPADSVDASIYNMPIPLTETHFKEGDNLRMVIVLGSGGSLWCDPTGATGEPLKLLTPFRIPN